MNQEVLNQIIESALAIIVLIITGYLLPAIKSWVKSKTNKELFNSAVQDIITQVDIAVNYLDQTCVNQLKEDGKFDKENQKEALNNAVSIVLKNISQSTTLYLYNNIDDVKSMIIQYIESNILNKKK